jgi:cation:H+ antiporter
VGAASSGEVDLAMGNVVGSNIANVLLVLGLSATLGVIHVSSRVVRLDVPIMIGVSLATALFALDGRLSRPECMLLLAGLLVFVTWTVRSSRRDRTADDPGAPPARRLGLPATLAAMAGGVGALVAAARLVVDGAGELAAAAGVPDLVIGLTVVAIGTSAPEIATSLVAAARGHRELAVGNAIGSNVINILLVLGAAGVVARGGLVVGEELRRLDLPVMVAAAVACLPVIGRGHALRRWEGFVFVGHYVLYITFLVVEALEHPFRDPIAVGATTFVIPQTIITFATLWWRHHRDARDGSLSRDVR